MRTLTVTALFFLCTVFCSAQTTWYVPDDFPTGIQAAISDASVLDGDTIIVRPGTYSESINYNGKALVLKSQTGPHGTMIRGTPSTPVVTFWSGEGSDSVLDGFTLSNGGGHTFFSNIAYGAGIYCEASPTIKNNIIRNNATYSIIHQGYGGGIYIDGAPLLENNWIDQNSADMDGGGVYVDGAGAILVNNVVSRNSAVGVTGSGTGGIKIVGDNITLVNNTITGNKLGVSVMFSVGSKMYNSIVRGNDGEDLTVSSSLDVQYCNVGYTVWPGTGNFTAVPGFVDGANGDYHLNFISPCRNAGNNAAAGLPALDWEGDPRIAYGTVDVGADEYSPHLYFTGDAVPEGAVDLKFIGFPGHLVNGLIVGVNLFDPPLWCDYGLWYMDNPFTVLTGLGAIHAKGILVYPALIPKTPLGPYTVYLQAVIDLELTNLKPLNVE